MTGEKEGIATILVTSEGKRLDKEYLWYNNVDSNVPICQIRGIETFLSSYSSLGKVARWRRLVKVARVSVTWNSCPGCVV